MTLVVRGGEESCGIAPKLILDQAVQTLAIVGDALLENFYNVFD